MKTIKFVIAAVFAVVMGANSFAQSHDHSKMTDAKTENIKVSGNCSMCKARIEKAAKIDGVSNAKWDSKTKMLTIVYNPAQTNTDEVQKKVAAVGHDTEKYRADDKVYGKLHGCCQYR